MPMIDPQLRHSRMQASGRTYTAARGNTLVEYGVTGALVMVVCIIGLQFLNGNLSSAMAMIRDDMQSKQQNAEALHKMQAAMANGQVSGTLSATEQALLQETMGQKLQTTGANGSTEILANQLAATAALQLAAGKIDQNQYDILMRLSNQGHKIAQIESIVSSALKMANGDYATFNNMTFTIDGQTYQGKQLSALVGYNALFPKDFVTNDVLTTGYDRAGAELATFLDLYKEAQSSGALTDQATHDTVTSAATQIASLGEVVEDSVAQLGWGNTTADNIVNFQASNATHMKSDNICESGKFKKGGTICLL